MKKIFFIFAVIAFLSVFSCKKTIEPQPAADTHTPVLTVQNTATITVTPEITLTVTITPTVTITCVQEICNGLDDDCDGIIDNNMDAPLCSNQYGVCNGARMKCGGADGWLDCSSLVYEAHNPAYESGDETLCDGKDNNCNGSTDEMAVSLRPLCDNQNGVCAGAKKICGGVSGWMPCDDAVFENHNTAYEASETLCGDGLDNDCNGTADCDDALCAGTPACP